MLFHIGTLNSLPQCLAMAEAIAKRNAQLTVSQTGLLLQALQVREQDIKITLRQAKMFADKIKSHVAS